METNADCIFCKIIAGKLPAAKVYEDADTLAFMDQQLADRQKDLESAEQKRQEFESKNATMMPGSGGLTGKIEGKRLGDCPA